MKFDEAFLHTRGFEGGFVNDPDDPGGATNHGISLRWLLKFGRLSKHDYDSDGDLDADDIALMSLEDAREIYLMHFWSPWYEKLPQHLAIKLFDLGVNMGTRQAVKLYQQVVGTTPDGLFGPATMEASYKANMYHSYADVQLRFEERAARFYYDLTTRRHSLRKFLYGWLTRAYAVTL